MTYKNNQNSPILIILQTTKDEIHSVSANVIETARSLGAKEGRRVYGILLCKEVNSKLKDELQKTGLSEVFVCQNKSFDSFIPELYVDTIEKCVENLQPDVVLAGATPEGRMLSSMLAARLKTGVTADCTQLSFNSDGLLLQTRPAFGGNIMAQIMTPNARPQISTLRFGIPNDIDKNIKTEITMIDACLKFSLPNEYFSEWTEKVGLEKSSDSKIIIALGGGVSQKSDIERFQIIAKSLNVDLMCSRALVDRGWLDRNHQIGLSGQSISPNLLITLGISGSLQFLEGIHNAKRICSVNIDENAPILKIADCPIVGDLYDILACLENEK